MKSLKDSLMEGTITKIERQYRDFCNLCNGYGVSVEDICVAKTTKNNWAVYNGDRKVCLISNNILCDEIIDKYGIARKQS